MRPTHDLINKITAHYRAKDRAVYDVIEEVRRAFKDMISSLDKPTFVPSRQAQDGPPGAAGTNGITHFINDHYAYWSKQDRDTEIERSAGIRWRVADAEPDRFEFETGPDALPKMTRLHLSDRQRQANGSLGFSEAKFTFDEAVAYATAPAAATWRGIDLSGIVEVAAAPGGGGAELITNGTFEGSTYASRSATHPNQWVLNDDGSMAIASPGFGGVGSCVTMVVGSSGQLKSRSQQANFILGGSPSGGTDTCNGDGNGSSTGGPGLTSWAGDAAKAGALAYISLNKNKVYQLKFQMKLNAGSASTRNFSFGVYAHATNTPYGACNGSLGYSLGGDSAGGAVSATYTVWNSSRGTDARFVNVPFDNTYRLYTANIDTTGVGSDVLDPFFASIYFTSGGLTGTGSWQVDEVSFKLPSIAIDTSLIERAFTLDQFTFRPKLSSSGDTLTFAEVTGAYLVPKMAPSIVGGATATIPLSYGAISGFDFTAPVGTLVATDVFSHFFKRPGFGTNAMNIGLAANAAFFTAFKTGTQSANIRYTVPPTAPTVDGSLLTSTIPGVWSWTDPATIITKPSYNHRWVANGPFRVGTTVDGEWIPNTAFTITSVWLWRGTAGTAGTTTIVLKINGTTVHTATIAFNAASPTVQYSGLSVAVAAGDRVSIDITTVETGKPIDAALIIQGA